MRSWHNDKTDKISNGQCAHCWQSVECLQTANTHLIKLVYFAWITKPISHFFLRYFFTQYLYYGTWLPHRHATDIRISGTVNACRPLQMEHLRCECFKVKTNFWIMIKIDMHTKYNKWIFLPHLTWNVWNFERPLWIMCSTIPFVVRFHSVVFSSSVPSMTTHIKRKFHTLCVWAVTSVNIMAKSAEIECVDNKRGYV